MNMEIEQEKALVERARTNPDAFGELYDANYGPIFNYLLRRTASIADAQDLTSEVFMKAFKNIGKFKWCGIPFSAWLYRIASHEIANKYRKGKHEQSYNIDSTDNEIGNPVMNLLQVQDETKKYEDYFVIHDSMSRLPAKYREVISLRFFAEKEISEIAQILDKPESSVKTLLYRGLEKLRADIKEPAALKQELTGEARR
jgi:RNA polymerase sigma-70 factor (ECF subfamily)